MVVATFNAATGWAGRTITHDDGTFALEGHGAITAQAVLDYDRQGQLDWAYVGLREWVESLLQPAAPFASTAALEPTATVIATFNARTASFGKQITYADGRFTLEGHGEILAAVVMKLDAQELLDWDHEGLREWATAAAKAAPITDELGEQGWEAQGWDVYLDRAGDHHKRLLAAEAGGRPHQHECDVIMKSVDESRDMDDLLTLRAAAWQIWDPQGSLGDPPQAAETWLEDLVDRINARLRILNPRIDLKPPAIVGGRHHQEALGRVLRAAAGSNGRRSTATLVPEPGNGYDPNAVAVMVKGERIGYLQREMAAVYSPPLQRMGRPLECRVRLERQRPGSEGVILAYFQKMLPAPSTLA